MTTNLAVNIVRYVDDHQPGWVESQFLDAKGRRHSFVDKVPSFASAGPLDANTAYPQSGYVACEVLSRSQDEQGRSVAHITTARPYYIESTDGLSEFDVLSTQLADLGVD
jgi:hypothetical protein